VEAHGGINQRAVENCVVLFSMGIEDASEAIQQRK
jgi:hypothetical protein